LGLKSGADHKNLLHFKTPHINHVKHNGSNSYKNILSPLHYWKEKRYLSRCLIRRWRRGKRRRQPRCGCITKGTFVKEMESQTERNSGGSWNVHDSPWRDIQDKRMLKIYKETLLARNGRRSKDM